MERFLQVGDGSGVGDTFDRFHLGAVALGRKHQAPANNHAVDPNGAGAAYAMLATDMTAGEAKIVAQEIHERLAGLDSGAHRLAVHIERNRNRNRAHVLAPASSAATRLSSTPARYFLVAP